MTSVSQGHKTRQRIHAPKRSRGQWQPVRDQTPQGKGKQRMLAPRASRLFDNWHIIRVRWSIYWLSCRCVQIPVCKTRLKRCTSLVLHTQSHDRARCVSTKQLFLTCCEVFPADSRVFGRLPALSLYCSDPLVSPPLSQHQKHEESKAIALSVAIHAAIGSLSTATNYSLHRPSLLLPTSKQFHVTWVTSRALIALAEIIYKRSTIIIYFQRGHSICIVAVLLSTSVLGNIYANMTVSYVTINIPRQHFCDC